MARLSSAGCWLQSGAIHSSVMPGQQTLMIDQRGCTHAYDYDLLGRPTHDRVLDLGAGAVGPVRRLSTIYNTRGMVEKVTSWRDPRWSRSPGNPPVKSPELFPGATKMLALVAIILAHVLIKCFVSSSRPTTNGSDLNTTSGSSIRVKAQPCGSSIRVKAQPCRNMVAA